MSFLKLQKWQTNDLFAAIRGVGLDPREFVFENGDTEARLKHKWSTSRFIFDENGATFAGRYAVGDNYEWTYTVYSWQTLMERFNGWLGQVKLDLDTPDLWAELQRETELLGNASGEATENTPFTAEEQKEIARRLQELAEYARLTYSLSEEQMRRLNAKIDNLIDAASRLGRTDWLGVFIGVIASYILTAGLSPESARSMFWTFMTLLRAAGHLFGHGLPELPAGGF